jgi:hypothetical protein
LSVFGDKSDHSLSLFELFGIGPEIEHGFFDSYRKVILVLNNVLISTSGTYLKMWFSVFRPFEFSDLGYLDRSGPLPRNSIFWHLMWILDLRDSFGLKFRTVRVFRGNDRRIRDEFRAKIFLAIPDSCKLRNF